MYHDNKLSSCILIKNIQHVSWQQLSSCILPTNTQNVSCQQTFNMYLDNKHSICILTATLFTYLAKISWQQTVFMYLDNIQHVSWQQTVFMYLDNKLSTCILTATLVMCLANKHSWYHDTCYCFCRSKKSALVRAPYCLLWLCTYITRGAKIF